MTYIPPNWHGTQRSPFEIGFGGGFSTLSTQLIHGLGCLDSGFLNSFSIFEESFLVFVFTM